MSQLFRRPGRIPGLTCQKSAYVWATLWVGGAFVLRLALQPVFHQGQIYSLFWPGVVLAAYVFGRRPAAWATLLSGVVAFFAFATPQFAWKVEAQPLTSLAFFFVNAAVAIYLITALTAGLAFLAYGLLGLRENAGPRWARNLFFFSPVYLPVVFGVLMLDKR